MARRALGKRLAELTGKKVDRKLGKKVNLRGQGYQDYFTYIPATKPQFSPWLDMSMKDMFDTYKKNNKYDNSGTDFLHGELDKSVNYYKFKFNDKEYFMPESVSTFRYSDEEVIDFSNYRGSKVDFDFKLVSLDGKEAADIGEVVTEMTEGYLDIDDFINNSKIQVTGKLTHKQYKEAYKAYSTQGPRMDEFQKTKIERTIFERTPEQIEFDNNWDEHLKQERLKSKRALQQDFDAIKVEARYKEERRAKRQADLEAAFNGTTEPEIITNPVNTTETVQTTKQARAAAAANAGPEVMQGEVVDPVTKTKSKLGIKNGEGNYRFPPQETGPMSFPKFKKDSEGNYFNARNVVATNEAAEQMVKQTADEAVNVGNPYFKQVFSGRNLGAVLNLGFAISDYNEARNAGDGVVKSAAKAGAQFVAGEMLGAWMFPVMLAKQVPSIAVNTIEATQQMTRQMNSTSRIQTFGEAQFRDTQQLATMRQAGMEMAKMSQYNLQQSIMGNEAQYMHRL